MFFLLFIESATNISKKKSQFNDQKLQKFP